MTRGLRFVQLSGDAEEPSRPGMSHFILKHEFGVRESSSSVRAGKALDGSELLGSQHPGSAWKLQIPTCQEVT